MKEIIRVLIKGVGDGGGKSWNGFGAFKYDIIINDARAPLL